MPNTPALVMAGMSGVCANAYATHKDMQVAVNKDGQGSNDSLSSSSAKQPKRTRKKIKQGRQASQTFFKITVKFKVMYKSTVLPSVNVIA